MSTNPETRTKLDDREDDFRLDRREVIQKSLAATAVAAGAFSPSIKALAQSTPSVSPVCISFPGLDIKRRPVTWPIGGNLFTWDIPKAPASSYSGSFTLEVEGSLLHSGTAAVSADEPSKSISFFHELVEDSKSLVVSATSSIIDAEDEGRLSRTVGTVNGFPFGFDYDSLSQQLMNTFQDPAVAEIVSDFNLQPYGDYSSQVVDVIPPMNAAIYQEMLLSCGVHNSRRGFWTCLLTCASVVALGFCCIELLNPPCCLAVPAAAGACGLCLDGGAQA